jgi:hypothetical protein
MTSKRRSYQAFLKRAKADYGLTHRKAQVMYRKMSDRLGEPAKAKDIKSHPRIAKQEAGKALRARGRREVGREEPKHKAPPPAPPVAPGPEKVIKSHAEYVRLYDEYDGFDELGWEYEEYAGGVDYNGEE